jgi:hypothetical protein
MTSENYEETACGYDLDLPTITCLIPLEKQLKVSVLGPFTLGREYYNFKWHGMCKACIMFQVLNIILMMLSFWSCASLMNI